MFSFAQTVYHWNSEEYSNGAAIDKLVGALGGITIAPVLIKV